MSWFVFEEAPEALTEQLEKAETWGHFIGELIPTGVGNGFVENYNICVVSSFTWD